MKDFSIHVGEDHVLLDFGDVCVRVLRAEEGLVGCDIESMAGARIRGTWVSGQEVREFVNPS